MTAHERLKTAEYVITSLMNDGYISSNDISSWTGLVAAITGAMERATESTIRRFENIRRVSIDHKQDTNVIKVDKLGAYVYARDIQGVIDALRKGV
jgi:hypothetical protein